MGTGTIDCGSSSSTCHTDPTYVRGRIIVAPLPQNVLPRHRKLHVFLVCEITSAVLAYAVHTVRSSGNSRVQFSPCYYVQVSGRPDPP